MIQLFHLLRCPLRLPTELTFHLHQTVPLHRHRLELLVILATKHHMQQRTNLANFVLPSLITDPPRHRCTLGYCAQLVPAVPAVPDLVDCDYRPRPR
jgi:hypothetical protein